MSSVFLSKIVKKWSYVGDCKLKMEKNTEANLEEGVGLALCVAFSEDFKRMASERATFQCETG